jgi:hypothetical protein
MYVLHPSLLSGGKPDEFDKKAKSKFAKCYHFFLFRLSLVLGDFSNRSERLLNIFILMKLPTVMSSLTMYLLKKKPI